MSLTDLILPLLGALGVGAILKTLLDHFLNRPTSKQNYNHKEWEYLINEVERLRVRLDEAEKQLSEVNSRVVELEQDSNLFKLARKTIIDVYTVLTSGNELAIQSAIRLIEVILPVINYDED